MTASYPSMFAFGVLLLLSWTGWGAGVERLLLRRAVADRPLQAGWGMAFTVLVGGLLNLAGVISPTLIHLFLVTGLVLLAWSAWRGRRRAVSRLRRRLRLLRARPLLALAALVVLAMMVTAYAATVCAKDYNAHDDLQAYFVFPVKMIQTGAMGPDPFSEGRMLSLGGMSFLQAIVLSVADVRYFRLVEPAVAFPLVVGLLLGVARDARAGPWAAAVAAFLFLAVPPPAKNAASLVTGLVLFLTLFRSLSRVALRGRPGPRGAVLAALIVSALTALKTTYVTASALTVVAAYLLRARNRRARLAAPGQLIVAGALTLVFLAPWMIVSYESNGTPLYPLFGRGFHGSAYESDWTPYRTPTLASFGERIWAVGTDPKVAPLWILGLGLLVGRRCGVGRGALAAFSLAALAAYLALVDIHPGAYRYTWAALWGATLSLLIYSFREVAVAPRGGWASAWRATPVVAAVTMLAVAHGADAGEYWASRRWAIHNAVVWAGDPGYKTGAAWRGKEMLDALPEGAVLLARVRYPFALDFTRHTIFVINYPGGSSPPPGMPFFQGAEVLADYLCAEGVRYVAYSYHSEASFSRKQYGYRLEPGTFPWTRAQALHTFDFQDNLVELGRTRRRIFDNGREFVLDLGVSATGEELPCGDREDQASLRGAAVSTVAAKRYSASTPETVAQ